MFTLQEKVDLRRFCGVPVYGTGEIATFQYFYYNRNLLFETRLNSMSSQEEGTVRTVYLTNLYQLEAAILTASDNLDTDVAAVWKHNKNESRDRIRLFDYWRERLKRFIFTEGELINTRAEV